MKGAQRSARRLGGALVTLALLGACGNTHRGNPATTAGSPATGGMPGSGTGGTGGAGGGAQIPASSHGVVPMHRLRGAEYVRSVADLFEVVATAPAPDDGPPFAAVIDDAKPWFAAAEQVARELFSKPQLPAPLACASEALADRTCAVSVIDELGLRAFRRPLLEAEKQAFTALFDALVADDGARGALEQVVRALLLSPAFLFHVELSDAPDASSPERLDSYALAARLSFALWSTTPDPALLQAAAADLTGDEALASAYERLTTDEQRMLALPDGLGDVWLRHADLQTHLVDTSELPSFSDELRLDMLDEQRELLRQFWLEPVPLRELLTLDLNYVTPGLSALYGFAPGTQGFAQIGSDARLGLLGQAGFLTLTSFERRVSATRRGKFVFDRLLCGKMSEAPPTDAGSLGASFPSGKSERQTLEEQVAYPACQSCHAPLDAIGLALAHFDAIGTYRERDSQDQPIDARVVLPEQVVAGAPSVDGLTELGPALAATPGFQACVAQQVASYLIHRDVSDQTDGDLIRPLAAQVADQADLNELTRQIVMSDHFRYRRMPPSP